MLVPRNLGFSCRNPTPPRGWVAGHDVWRTVKIGIQSIFLRHVSGGSATRKRSILLVTCGPLVTMLHSPSIYLMDAAEEVRKTISCLQLIRLNNPRSSIVTISVTVYLAFHPPQAVCVYWLDPNPIFYLPQEANRKNKGKLMATWNK